MTDIYMQSLMYVITAPNFWGAMGFTTAIGMFIGAMIYDGELTQAGKGIVSIISYAAMLLWINVSRIGETVSSPNFPHGAHPEYAFAGIITVMTVTLAWVLGVFLGVMIFNIKYKGTHRPTF